jgi:L-methionine (R)-S-oxide reductase
MFANSSAVQEWLSGFIETTGGVAGTVHLRQGDGLALAAAVNIPQPVAEVVRWVPWGKGMAGMALETGEAVTTCNLKEDDTGKVKPGAKAVSAQAAIALPIKDATGSVTAVVGVAFKEEREIGQAEIDRLIDNASTLPVQLTENA